jgi:c(7)-type cytochrome triheme protein
MIRPIPTLLVPVLAAALLGSAPALAQDKGKALYEKSCSGCHGTGVAGAPTFGKADDWAPRIKNGIASLYESALKGKPPMMPPKGGAMDASDADVKAAVDYMVAAAKGGAKAEAKPAAVAAADPAPAAAAPAAAAPAAPPAAAPAAAAPAPTPAPQAAAAATPAARDVNRFNRLLKPLGKRNLPPAEDGIHDPANEGTLALQPPLAAFETLPRSNAGNRVDWVKALEGNAISPRWDRIDGNAAPVVMDLNIVREVKGSMPDVVYPHKQHTEWLDCSNCHPAIFIPQKGANQISMAAILLGQKCGVCHGKVAFPVSECRLCHSKKKDTMPVRTSAN